MKLNKYFSSEEFACKCCKRENINNKLIEELTKIREHFNRPIIITSGFRCPDNNKKQGGAKFSYHIKGLACDFYIQGIKPKEIINAINELFPNKYGAIEYINRVHFDVRDSFYRDKKNS